MTNAPKEELFREAATQELHELLSELEATVLDLEREADQPAHVDAVFRVLHTIKGNAHMFGFHAVSLLAHEIETVFDLVRGGGLGVSRALIDLTLRARDYLRSTVEAGALEQGPGPEGLQLAEAFRALRNASVPAAALDQRLESPTEPGQLARYRIKFRPDPDILLTGANPLAVLEELAGLGVCHVVAHTDRIPLLQEIDPEACYTSWEIELETSHGRSAIREVFLLVEDRCELSIELAGEQAPPNGVGPQPRGLHRAGDREQEWGRPSPSSIRVASRKLDTLVDLVGQLVTVQARLMSFAHGKGEGGLLPIAEEVERLTTGLRESAFSLRMVPMGSTFREYERLLRDLSRQTGKLVELRTAGAETELDKNIIDKLKDPLVHLVNNSVAHGIEPPDVRSAAGKPACGVVHLSAEQLGAEVVIRVRDDGAGMDVASIRRKSVERRLIQPDAEMTDKEILALAFSPGLTTASHVTGVSGRGVGLDVVRQVIEQLRGIVEVDSEPSKGTTVTLRLPLTLAIVPGLHVVVGTERYIIPMAFVEECVELTEAQARRFHGRPLIMVRDEMISYIRLRDHFGTGGKRPPIEQVVVTSHNACRVGLAVDHVIGEHQTVLKSLGRAFRQVGGITGATIMGDGTIALIVDVPAVASGAAEAVVDPGSDPSGGGGGKRRARESGLGSPA